MSAEPTSRVNQKTSDLSYSLMGSVQAGLPMSDEAIEAGGLTAQELEMLKRFNSKRREELMLCLFIVVGSISLPSAILLLSPLFTPS